jgi:hypothetical protein
MAVQRDLDLIQGLEKELFKQAVRGSSDEVGKLLADNFVEFGRSGRVYHKEEVIRSLTAESAGDVQTLTASDFALKPLADGVVLLTYRSLRRGEDGRELHSLRSSIWKLIGGRWRMVFHQGTPTNPAQ